MLQGGAGKEQWHVCRVLGAQQLCTKGQDSHLESTNSYEYALSFFVGQPDSQPLIFRELLTSSCWYTLGPFFPPLKVQSCPGEYGL